MATIKTKWNAQMGFSVSGAHVRFKGREAFKAPSETGKKALLALGVFEELQDGTLRYSAPVKFRCKCAKESQCTWVDEDGLVEFDPEHLRNDLIEAGLHKELEIDGKPVAAETLSAGVTSDGQGK